MKPRKLGRTAQTVRILIGLCALGAVLTFYNAYSSRRDAQLATAEKSEQQRRFFVDASQRPDLGIFFKSLSHDERVTMSKAIGRYDDAEDAALIGTCLETFDVEAREALTASLIHLVKSQPESVIKLLERPGGFQQRAVRSALKTLGDSALPKIAEQLKVGGARGNAADVLVEFGEKSAQYVRPLLADDDADVRVACADILGKLRVAAAIPMLRKLADSKTGNERAIYIGAISAIGDPATESYVSEQLENPSNPADVRAQCALGLGLIASPSATRQLAAHLDDAETSIRRGAVDGLRHIGAAALVLPLSDRDKLEIATGIAGPAANSVIRDALSKENLAVDAAAACAGRPEMQSELVAALRRYQSKGDVVSQIVSVLSGTEVGRQLLAKLEKDPLLEGFVRRAVG